MPRVGDVSAATAAVGVTVVGRVAGRVVHILFLIGLARWLGPASFGAFVIGWGVVRLGAYLSTLGVEQAALRFGASHWPDDAAGLRDVVQKSLGITFAGTAALTAMSTGFARWLGTEAFGDPAVGEVLLAFSAGLPFMALLTVASSLARLGTRGVVATLAEDIVQPVTAVLVTMSIAVIAGVDATRAAWAVNLSFAIALVFAFKFLWTHFAKARASTGPRRHALGVFLGFAVIAGLPSRLSIVLTWGDRVLIGHYLSAADTGAYQAMAQITMVVPMVLAAVGAGIAPTIARMSQLREHEELARLYGISTRLALYVSVPFLLVGLALPGELVRVCYGEGYTADGAPLAILMAGQLVNVATGVVGVMLVMTGHARTWLGLSAATVVISLTLNVVLIPNAGLRGAALATTLATIALNLTSLGYARSVLGVWPYDRRIFPVLWAAVAATVTLAALRGLDLTALQAVILGATSSVVTFGGVLYLLARQDLLAVLKTFK